jgi:hypothetical protein
VRVPLGAVVAMLAKKFEIAKALVLDVKFPNVREGAVFVFL